VRADPGSRAGPRWARRSGCSAAARSRPRRRPASRREPSIFRPASSWRSPAQKLARAAGPVLEVRAYAERGLWASAGAGAELCANMDNPERGRLVTLLAASLAAGAWTDPWPRLTCWVAGRVDWMSARGADLGGPRAGPTVSAAWMLGRAFGHPMGLEARAAYLLGSASGGDRAGAATGRPAPHRRAVAGSPAAWPFALSRAFERPPRLGQRCRRTHSLERDGLDAPARLREEAGDRRGSHTIPDVRRFLHSQPVNAGDLLPSYLTGHRHRRCRCIADGGIAGSARHPRRRC
jgi:hypothetical protein